MRRLRLVLSAVLGSAIIAACAETPTPSTDEPDRSLPVLPQDLRDVPRMEAMLGGMLTRKGDCLYLDTGENEYLIIWSDDVRAAQLDDSDWMVNDYTTGQRFREGDMVRGGGGTQPTDADLAAITEPDPPADCIGPAVQFYDVRKYDPASPGGVPEPPPPPPPGPSLIDMARNPDAPEGPSFTMPGVADPREALFLLLVREFRERGPEPPVLCLRASGNLLARLQARYPALRSEDACHWQDGGVVSVDGGKRAMFLHAEVECEGDRCFAEGGATYGNLGAEANAYRLERRGDGWRIQQLGIQIMS